MSDDPLTSIDEKYLFEKLDEALTRDLKDRSSTSKVNICSKVWSEIIKRSQDTTIQSILQKIKGSYEQHLKY